MKYLIPLFALAAACSKTPEQMTYPLTPKSIASDEYFGTEVLDPYRWMEDDTSQVTAEWTEEENKTTFAFLDKIPFRPLLRKRLDELFNYERMGAPDKQGAYYYYYLNDGLQNHSVLYRKENLREKKGEVFLDPNTFSKDGTTKLSGISFSKDGSRAGYLVSKGGADWNEIVVIDAKSKQQLEDTLRHVKFTGVAWRGNDGFYYSSYSATGGSALSAKTNHHILYYHKIGTPQKEDKVIFGDEKNPRRYVNGRLTEDERFLAVTAANSTTGNELYIQDLSKPNSKLMPVVTSMEHEYDVVTNDGDRILARTNFEAPNGKVAEMYASQETPQWKDVIPETSNPLFVSVGGGKIFARYLRDVKTEVRQFDLYGKLEGVVKLPGIGTAYGFDGKQEEKDLYYTFTSFTSPPAIYKYSIPKKTSELYFRPAAAFNPDDYETEQVFYNSKDGTRIPMFITYKKGMTKNGENATLLYGYGGFSISLLPEFKTSLMAWLENGGVYAQPNLRGGGEYGEKWHLAGTKMNKQNVFDDFIAAAEYLHAQKYTSPDFTALMGGSNGGLLVGAVMTQRPDLAKVALPAVGVMDMLRYHKFPSGAGWAYDFGTAEDSEEMFKYLKKYSPLHALKSGAYPATLVTTADHDDRVVPAHSFKFAATLQEVQTGSNPVLIRIDTKSGHGASNLSKQLDVTADQYSFALFCMGKKPADDLLK